jgi:hypothetical protein
MRWLAVLWKVYLVAWIAIRTVHLSGKFLAVPSLTAASYLVLGAVGFIPVVGFILEKPFLRPIVWRAWLLFALCWALFDLIYFAEWFAQHPLWVQVTGISLAVPTYVAVYVYSRPSSRPWATRPAL